MYQQNYQQPFYGNGFTYGARPMPKCTQPVTVELQKVLNQQSNELDIRISNTDKVKNWCTHKEPTTGRMALVENSDGTVTCRVCGETFHMVDMTLEQVKAACATVVDILQTIKVMYLDSPEEFTKAFYQTLSMIAKIPDLWERANKNFSLYENYTGNVFNNNPSVNSFAAANGILGGFGVFGQQMPMGGYGYGYYGNPAAPQGWPMQGQAPMQQQVAPQPVNPQMMQQMGQMTNPGGPWATPNPGWPTQGQATMPYVDQNGQVMPGAPMGPTTMNGNPMAPGFNPLVNNGSPGAAMSAPAPTGPATQQTATAEPTQTKTMTV